MSLKDKILVCLQKQPHTINELVHKLHCSPSGIRGRISDLRKEGHDITFTNNKYILNFTIDNKIVDIIENNNLWGQDIKYDIISRNLKVPIADVVSAMTRLFKKYNVIQTSNGSVRILKIQ